MKECQGFEDKEFINKYIMSPEVKELIVQTCHYFSDSEKATIIYNSNENLLEIHGDLQSIASKTSDVKLRLQIEERLAFNHKAIEQFAVDGDNYYYVLSIIENDDYIEYQRFKKLGLALNSGKEYKRDFTIEKYHMPENSSLPVAQFWYDADARIKYFYSNEYASEDSNILNESDENRFENAFIVIPNPYGVGDVVRVIGGTDRAGIVSTSKYLWSQYVKHALLPGSGYEWCDVGIEVRYSEDGLDHEHINPIFLEKVDS